MEGAFRIIFFIKFSVITEMKILNVLQDIESELAYKKVSWVTPTTFYGLEAHGAQWEVENLKIRDIFSLVISKLSPTLSTVQLDVVKNHIN